MGFLPVHYVGGCVKKVNIDPFKLSFLCLLQYAGGSLGI